MEREKELSKLVNVLQQTARAATQAQWGEASEDADRVCVDRYNRVLARLKELEPAVGSSRPPTPVELTQPAVGSSLPQGH